MQPNQITSNKKTNDNPKKDILKSDENTPIASVVENEQIFLKQGDCGNKVKELQVKLNKFRYKLTTDGEFGPSTDFAVRNFQAKVGIPVDGVAGPETIKKLDSTPAQAPYLYESVKGNIDSPQAKSLTNNYEAFLNSKDCSSNTGYYIYTNLSKHIVFVFTGSNHNWKLISSFPCSSGAPSTPTIRGHFVLGSRGTYFVTDNGLICKYYTQISGNYLFHSILYDQKGNVVDGRLGVNISHGCIRLATANAKYLYDNIPSETTIWIQ